MTLILNGQSKRIEAAKLSVQELLEAIEMNTAPVLVELNGEALLKKEFQETRVKDGDRIEIIRMVAGG